MAAFEEVGKGFVNQYYSVFGTNPMACRGVYRDNSLMTWMGTQLCGTEGIMAKFTTLAFGQAKFQLEDIDCHPSLSNGVIVVVNGELLMVGEAHSLKFNDFFHLAQDAAGAWYISNQIFRIIGGGGHGANA